MKIIKNIMAMAICLLLVFLLSGCKKSVRPDIISFRDTNDKLLMSGDVIKYAEAGEDAAGNPCIVLKILDTKKFYSVTEEISKKYDNRIVIWYKFDEEKNSFKESENNCGYLKDPSCLSTALVSQAYDSDEILITASFTKAEVSKMVSLINE